MQMFAGGNPVTNKLEQQLGLFLMFNGDWEESEERVGLDFEAEVQQ